MIIRTRKLIATDTLGERVKATGGSTSVTVPWDYGLNEEQMYMEAARMLAQRVAGSDTVPEVALIRPLEFGYEFESKS